MLIKIFSKLRTKSSDVIDVVSFCCWKGEKSDATNWWRLLFTHVTFKHILNMATLQGGSLSPARQNIHHCQRLLVQISVTKGKTRTTLTSEAFIGNAYWWSQYKNLPTKSHEQFSGYVLIEKSIFFLSFLKGKHLWRLWFRRNYHISPERFIPSSSQSTWILDSSEILAQLSWKLYLQSCLVYYLLC